VRTLLIYSMVLASGGCVAEPAPRQWASINSGNEVLDQFLANIRDKDATAVAKLVEFKPISRWLPQYTTASEYLAFIDDCALVSVKATGSNSDLFWVNWTCSDGAFRQAFNTAYEAPKVMASEMLKPNSDERREKTSG
jgi:hypothetical protein